MIKSHLYLLNALFQVICNFHSDIHSCTGNNKDQVTCVAARCTVFDNTSENTNTNYQITRPSDYHITKIHSVHPEMLTWPPKD